MNCCIESSTSADNILISDDIPENRDLGSVLIKQKIRRPPNAFMLYANEHRKSLAHLYPADSNKEISRRLGQTWKDLNLQEKNCYFQKARDIDKEHKRKYPGYVYNPKDARLRKAIRTNFRDRSTIGSASSSMIANNNNNNNNSNNRSTYIRRETEKDNNNSSIWNGITEQNFNLLNHHHQRSVTENSTFDIEGNKTTNLFDTELGALPFNLIENSEEDRMLYEKEKASLEAAENYTKNDKYEENEEAAKSNYLPISATKFTKDPELFTNNAEYHREYIIKYFNHIPDYETYNVTTDDGISFPYVTIPNLIVSQNIGRISYNN